MIKKIIVWTLLVGLFGLLIISGINRTLARTENSSLVNKLDRTLNKTESSSLEKRLDPTAGANRQENTGGSQNVGSEQYGGKGGNGNGHKQGGGRGRSADSSGQTVGTGLGCTNQPGDGQSQIVEWVEFEARVASIESGLLTLTRANGQQVQIVGRTTRYIQEMGFTLQAGDQVYVSGFYDANNVLGISKIENLTSGESVTIRDETGRPRWAGGGSY